MWNYLRFLNFLLNSISKKNWYASLVLLFAYSCGWLKNKFYRLKSKGNFYSNTYIFSLFNKSRDRKKKMIIINHVVTTSVWCSSGMLAQYRHIQIFALPIWTSYGSLNMINIFISLFVIISKISFNPTTAQWHICE